MHASSESRRQESENRKKEQNMTIHKFEDLEIWQMSKDLASDIYKSLKDSKEFEFKSHIFKSAVSVPSNISEGFERKSNKEYIQFLYIALGSNAELRTQLIIANEIAMINKGKSGEYIEETRKISAKIRSLIQTRKTRFV